MNTMNQEQMEASLLSNMLFNIKEAAKEFGVTSPKVVSSIDDQGMVTIRIGGGIQSAMASIN